MSVRLAGSAEDRIRALASELVAEAPNVILVNSNPGLVAVMQATRTIPVVFTQVADPVGSRFVASLARPGGNVTGFTNFETSMGGKWLEALKEIAPDVKRAAVLLHPETAANVEFLRAAEAASSTMQMAVVAAPVHNAAEIERAITEFAREPNGGVIALPHVVTAEHRELIAGLSLQQRLPSVGAFRFMATSGALLSYGIDVIDLFRRACTYIDRILRGEKPLDLPVQAPTKFELVVNLKTAKGLGLKIPESFLLRADEVIE
jgi:putative ABC transport system substrate-binding protein